MPTRRYHVHIIGVAHDQPRILDSLAIFFQARAFLTYDVSAELPYASLYSRQCIDACDYTIVLVGDNYGVGTAQNMGVSQMHLSYLSAKAKLKPMIILIKTLNKELEASKQLKDFTRMLEQQASLIYYYEDSTDIRQLLNNAHQDMAGNHLLASWVKSAAEEESSIHNQSAQRDGGAGNADASQSGQSTSKQKSKVKVHPNNTEQNLKLAETFAVKYSAQAYEGGNLTDITISTEITWQQVLQALAKIPAAFSSYGLQSAINRLITSKAEQDIKQRMPNVHAVSRCQMAQNDLSRLQRSLIKANWIQLTAAAVSSSQELWELTSYAESLIKDNQAKAAHWN